MPNRDILQPGPPRAPTDASRARFRRALGREFGVCALPFVEAVVVQLVYPLGGPAPASPEEAERAVGDRVVAMLGASTADPHFTARAAADLAADAALLAAFFQNVDLLHSHRCPHADAVSLLVMAALERLSPAA